MTSVIRNYISMILSLTLSPMAMQTPGEVAQQAVDADVHAVHMGLSTLTDGHKVPAPAVRNRQSMHDGACFKEVCVSADS